MTFSKFAFKCVLRYVKQIRQYKYYLNQLSFNVDVFPFKIQGFECRFTMSKTYNLNKTLKIA